MDDTKTVDIENVSISCIHADEERKENDEELH